MCQLFHRSRVRFDRSRLVHVHGSFVVDVPRTCSFFVLRTHAHFVHRIVVIPSSPQFGSVWERNVASLKSSLVRPRVCALCASRARWACHVCRASTAVAGAPAPSPASGPHCCRRSPPAIIGPWRPDGRKEFAQHRNKKTRVIKKRELGTLETFHNNALATHFPCKIIYINTCGRF